MYKFVIKRFFDFILSFIGIIVLAIPMLIIAIAVKLDSRGPILFKQKRLGIHKKQFTMLKFRSMRMETPSEAPTHELMDPTKWITKIGGFLRKTSLDELPQIFNIFVGQMSIIGPRPCIWNQHELIDERDKYGANDIKPGLTGWAQVNGRDVLAANTQKKVEYDAYYVQHCSFWLDVKIFFMTVVKVFKRDGIVEGVITEDNIDMEKITTKDKLDMEGSKTKEVLDNFESTNQEVG